MKKIKLLSLSAIPLALATTPIFATSCGNANLTNVSLSSNEIDKTALRIETLDDLQSWQYTFFNEIVMKKGFDIDRLHYWKLHGVDYISKSIYNSELLNDISDNFDAYSLLIGFLWSLQSTFIERIDLVYDALPPADITFNFNLGYNKEDQTCTGLGNFEFTSSNNVRFAMSIYMPEPVKLSAAYLSPEDRAKGAFKTISGKESIQNVVSYTDASAETEVTTLNSSAYIADFNFFFKSDDPFAGPTAEEEVWIKDDNARPTGDECKILDYVEFKDEEVGGSSKEDWNFAIVMDKEQQAQEAQLEVLEDGVTIKKLNADANWPNTVNVIATNDKSGSLHVADLQLYSKPIIVPDDSTSVLNCTYMKPDENDINAGLLVLLTINSAGTEASGLKLKLNNFPASASITYKFYKDTTEFVTTDIMYDATKGVTIPAATTMDPGLQTITIKAFEGDDDYNVKAQTTLLIILPE